MSKADLMSKADPGSGKKPRHRIRKWLKSAAGISTSVAGIATSAATILGLFAAHQSAQIRHYGQVVRHQTQQIRELRAQPRPTVTVSAMPPADTADGGASSSGQEYLYSMQPTVDNGESDQEGTTIGGQSYPQSVAFYCTGTANGQPTEAWDVAGMNTFSAVVGVPDDSSDVTGYVGTLSFANQDGRQLGKTVSVSLGHPSRVMLNIGGVTQLDVTCYAHDPSSGNSEVNGLQVALGNARIVS